MIDEELHDVIKYCNLAKEHPEHSGMINQIAYEEYVHARHLKWLFPNVQYDELLWREAETALNLS